MARIDLRDTTILIKDGLSGTAVINQGEFSVATVNMVAANADMTFTAPAQGTSYDGTIFDVVNTGTVAVSWNVTASTFTLNYDSANGTTAAQMKTAFDANIVANPTWPAWTCAVEGAGGGVIDDANGTSAGGENPPAATGTSVPVASIVLNTTDTDLIPVGARFTPNTVNHTTVHTVTARSPVNTSPTTSITFTPAWGAPTPIDGAILTFTSQQLEVKIGEGNLTYTESKEYQYLLDRGELDTVRDGADQPVEVNLEFVYEYVTAGTGEDVTPVDAIKQIGDATEWVSSSADLCEPYAVDIVILHEPPCGTTQDETTVLPDFRYESLEFNLNDATIAVTGRCNVVSATVSRG